MTTTAFSAPSEEEIKIAEEMSRVLASRQGLSVSLRVSKNKDIQLPSSIAGLLERILEETAKGNAVMLTPVHAELTTQEAADLLNVSRPSLIQLLDEGKVEFRRVGTHRRVRFDSLMKYKRETMIQRKAVLDQLAAYDQEIGL